MNRRDREIRREIVLVILLKLLALTALWWCFVRDARVTVDTEEAALRFAVLAPPNGRPAQPPGESSAH